MKRWVIEAQDGHTTWYARGFREVPFLERVLIGAKDSSWLEVDWTEDLRYAHRFDSEVEVAATVLRMEYEYDILGGDEHEPARVREIDIPADLLAAECAYRGLKGAF